MEEIIERLEKLRKDILADKNASVFDKAEYCFDILDIRLLVEDLELKSDLLHNVICITPWKDGLTWGVSYKVLAVLDHEYVIEDDDECTMLIGKTAFK